MTVLHRFKCSLYPQMRSFSILFILMNFPMHIYRIKIELPILYLRARRKTFLNYDVFLSCRCVFIFSNSGDSDEMSHLATFVFCLFA